MSRQRFNLVKCRVCKQLYKRAVKISKGRPHGKGIRGLKTVTCSTRCSKLNCDNLNNSWYMKRKEKARSNIELYGEGLKL